MFNILEVTVINIYGLGITNRNCTINELLHGLNHAVIGILCLWNIWWCAYTSPWVSQTDASIRRAALAPRRTTALKGLQRALSVCSHQGFQSTVFFKTKIFTCPVHLSVLPFLCTAFGQRCDNHYNNLRSPKGGMLFELRFISWFLHSGISPKIYKMCGHKLWTTIIVSCLDVDEDGWCNSLCKYETKIPAGNRTADPLSCVLASKYDDLNTMDQTFL